MANITLSIPDEIYRKMKKHPEIKWSEIARKAIIEYLNRLENITTCGEILKDLGRDFEERLSKISFEKAVEYYKGMRDKEWKRISTIPTS
ncbi:MAG: hypothetical protein DRJ32_02190 [Thermoprotei archaeon]|nr:MAG: hypothetical protein DRJ32_02190 [Thermoprotei archaeon]HDD64394.1 hypothetical protein [Thermoprotei archaeon]